MSRLKNILKYINSIPFEFTVKHYQIFGDQKSKLKDNALISIESWDALRLSHPHFSIPKARDEWLQASELKVTKDGQDNGLIVRAKDIAGLLSKEKINSVFSTGVGGAGLEYQIKKIKPEIKLVCSEYSEQNVSMLKNVFTECDNVITFDIIKGDWKCIVKTYLNDDYSALLMYRLDAGFTNEEWRTIFESIYNSGVKNIIYIPTTLLTFLSLWNRKSRELNWFLKKIPVSFAGHLRSKKTFEGFWSNLYKGEEMNFGGLKGFVLRKIDKN